MSFIFDSAGPVSGYDYPVVDNHYTPTLLGNEVTGTAADVTSDISEVYVDIEEVKTGYHFDGAAGFVNTGGDNWLPVTSGTTDWAYSNAAFTVGGNGWEESEYLFRSKGIDIIGNEETPSAGFTVVVDTTPPVSLVQVPDDDKIYKDVDLTFLSGTAADNSPGAVNNVQISINVLNYHESNNFRWDEDNSTWTDTGAFDLWLDAEGKDNWNYIFTAADWVTGKYYRIKSRAFDKAGQVETPSGYNEFRVVLQAHHFIVSGINSGSKAGTPLSFTVAAKDEYGGPALTYDGTIRFTTKDDEHDLFSHQEEEKSESDPIPDYTFTTTDQKNDASHTFSNLLRFYTAGSGSSGKFLVVYDTDTLVNGEQKDIAVIPDTPYRLQVIVPGELPAPGTGGGKKDDPDLPGNGPIPQLAGGSFNITVNICDDYFNVTDSTDTVTITATDPNFNSKDIYVDGSTTTSIQMDTAGNQTVSANSKEPPAARYIVYTSDLITVNPDTPKRLQIIFPGELPDPGTAAGKKDDPGEPGDGPIEQTAGTGFTITVNACDSKWNVNTSTTVWAEINTTDNYDEEPSSAALVSGTHEFVLEMVTASTQTVTAVCLDSDLDPTDGDVQVKYGSGKQLQVIVPGETAVPGKWYISPYGKTGSASTRTAGVAFTVTVSVCDDYWNVNTDTQVSVTVMGNDPHSIQPDPNPKTISAGSRNYNLTFKTAWTGAVRATWTVEATATEWTSYTSSKIPMKPNSATKLQVLLPNESPKPGSASGKQGEVQEQVAGVKFTVTVRAVDDYWNLQKSSNPEVIVTAPSASYYEAETGPSLFNGTTRFWVILKNAQDDPWQITASTTDGSNLYSNISSTVSVGPADGPSDVEKLMVLVPGEVWEPGSTYGRTGTPSTQTAGAIFTVTIRTVDEFWNKTNTGLNVDLTITDPNIDDSIYENISIIGGEKVSTVTFRTAGASWTVTVSTADGSDLAPHTSQDIYVEPDDTSKLLVITPGEVFDGGSLTGKSDNTPGPQTAGNPFKITVYACDYYFNRTTAAPTVGIEGPGGTDPNGEYPSSKPLVQGATTFIITFKTAHSTWTLETSNASYTDYTSSGIYVIPGEQKKLQILVPDEYPNPGSSPEGDGNAGSVQNQQAGITFTITVRGCDDYWNLQEEAEADVSVTSNYGGDIVAPFSLDLVDGIAVFDVTLAKANTTSYLSAEDLDSIKLSSYTHSGIECIPGIPVELQVLLPGESNVPCEGKTGAASTRTAGVEFAFTVISVDSNYNITPTTATVSITSDDSNAVLPSTNTLINGTTTFFITLKTANQNRLVFADEYDTGYGLLLDGSTAYVKPSDPVKLAAILPGQTYDPGTQNGKYGAIDISTAGKSFTVTVRACDYLWNTVTSTEPTVSLTTTDPNGVEPSDRILYNGQLLRLHSSRRTNSSGSSGRLPPPIQSSF